MPHRARLAGLVLLGALAGCSGGSSGPAPAPTGPVAVPSPTLAGGATPAPLVAQVCAKVLAALPDELREGLHRRGVTDPTRTAAWGRGPVVQLQCGTDPHPDGTPPFSTNGVAWTVLHGEDDSPEPDIDFRTSDRQVTVRVVVPRAADGAGELIGVLSARLAPVDPAAQAAPGA